MKHITLMLGLSTLLAIAPRVSSAEDSPSVDEIVDNANKAAYYQDDDGKATVHMSITDKQGRERTRDFIILRKDKEDGGDQWFYVYFKGPGDVRKMVFMVWKHPGADDDRWLYLPALDLVKRIAAADKRTSFVGSDFLYEDVSGRSTAEDRHELVETTDQFYVLNNTPVDPSGVEFDSYKVWIDKTTFLAMKAEYSKKSGEVYRVVEAGEVQTIQDHPTITRSEVKNLETGSTTVLTFSDVQYGIGLEESTFTERYLRRPPQEVRK